VNGGIPLLNNLSAGLLYVALAAVPLGVAVYSTDNLEKPGAGPLVVMSLGAAAATVVQGGRFIDPLLEVGPWFGTLLHIALLVGVNVAVLGALYIAVEYTGRSWFMASWIVLPLVLLAGALPVARILLLEAGSPSGDLVADADFVFRLVLAVAGLSLFARQFVGSRGIYRKQSAALLLGLAVGSGFGLLERYYTVQYVEFTLLGMTLGIGILAWALFRYEFLETVPIARETLFDQVTDPVVALDGTGRVVDLNAAASAAFGLTGSIIGEDIARFFREDASLGDQYRNVLGSKGIAGVVSDGSRHFDPAHPAVAVLCENDDVSTDTSFGVLRDGTVSYYQVSASDLEFAPGYEGRLLVFRDVTRSTEREQDLDILKQVLTRVLRHNLRNDAMAINGFATSIAENADEEARKKAERIVRLTQELTATSETARRIEDVIDADGPDAFDLAAEVRAVVDSVGADHPDATIEWSVPEETSVLANPEFPAALTEVVENAVVHGGDAPHVEVTAVRDGRWIALTVADDGPGIPDYELETIDQGEETPLVHGSGAGLWLIQTVVEDSNGDVTYDSGDDGTTVRLRLPAAEP